MHRGECLRQKVTVDIIRSNKNFFGYELEKTTGVAKQNRAKIIECFSKWKRKMEKRLQTSTGWGREIMQSRINQSKGSDQSVTECNDREGAKILKSVTECQLSEFEINSFPFNQICNFSMASINLENLSTPLFLYPEFTSGSSSEVEVSNARLEAVTTGSRDMKCHTVISILSSFRGRGVEILQPSFPANVVMSVIPLDFGLFSLKLVEANYKGDPQMRAIKKWWKWRAQISRGNYAQWRRMWYNIRTTSMFGRIVFGWTKDSLPLYHSEKRS